MTKRPKPSRKPVKLRTPALVKEDFHDAIDRILAGKPTHKDLRAKAGLGKLKLTKTDVALEAGRSAALLYRDDYADIALRIAENASPRRDRHVAPTHQAFRTMKDELEDVLDFARINWGTTTELQATILALEARNTRQAAELDRLKAELHGARVEISHLESQIGGGNVRRFPKT